VSKFPLFLISSLLKNNKEIKKVRIEIVLIVPFKKHWSVSWIIIRTLATIYR